jgi:lysozyme family protein
MSEESLEQIYRVTYWRRNEFQLIQFDFDNDAIRSEIAKCERLLQNIELRLGYMPQP